MIKALFFDIDNTLLDFEASSKRSMATAMEQFGIAYKESMFDVFTQINNGLWHDVELGKLTKAQLFEVRWQRIFDKLGISGVAVKDFEELFLKLLFTSHEKIDGADEILPYLHGRYEIYAASNAPAGQQQMRMQLAGLAQYVDGFLISEELGYAKPQKEYFDRCFALLPHLQKDEVLVIGDSGWADVEGPHAYGLKACHVDLTGGGSPSCAAYAVHNLYELKTIL